MSNPFIYSSPSSTLLSHIPSILPGPSWKGQECFHRAFSCRVAYYLLLLGTSNTQACKGANSLYQSPLLSPRTILLLLLSTSLFSPECLARRHAVSQHPALNEKGHLNSLEAEGSQGQLVCLLATFLPFQDRTGEMEQREQPFIWGFSLSFFFWSNSPHSCPWYPWISHSAKKGHHSDRAWFIWRGNWERNNNIPEGHPSLPAPDNRVPRSSIIGIQHSSLP